MPPPDQQVEIDFPPSLIEPEVPAVPVFKHEKYYLDDGDFYVLVENTLFRVHVHFLQRHSAVFKEELESPCPTGTHEDDAFVLKNVTVKDFALLLWVFYDKSLERQASGDEWLRILLAAENLRMPHVQNLAVDRLKDLSVPEADPVLIISVQQRYRDTVSRVWAREAFVRVCERQGRLTVEEGERIGILASVLIGHVREEDLLLRSQPEELLSCDLDGTPFYAKRPTVRDIVQRIIIQDEPPITPLNHEVLADSKLFECNVEGANLVVYAGQHKFSIHRHFLEQHSPLIGQMLRPVTPRQEQQWETVEGSNDTVTLNVDARPSNNGPQSVLSRSNTKWT
ncbi:hypothetical protein BDN71DRAFT_161601 [Pleurotus eryngii]|uniref:BTB domain-containing protein n=1 Tax=Pleurotus eryngii TaxID=5323 RepID=A0A9P6D4B8_PLEER|nr:hypothetical protein BDN71DRAFT_161601 [Pleurotus eryngii]